MSTGKPQQSLQKPPGFKNPPAIPPPRPPPIRPPPPIRHQEKRRSSCCRTLCCCIFILSFIMLLLLVSAAGFFYLFFHPRLLQIQLKSLNFTKFNVTATSDDPTLDARSTITFKLKNPNHKLRITYDRAQVLVYSSSLNVNLGEETVPGFTQEKGNVTILKFETNAMNAILDGKSAELLKNRFKNKNLVINAEMRTGVGLKWSGWRTGPVQVNIICSGMSLNRPVQGPECRIKLFNWIYIN